MDSGATINPVHYDAQKHLVRAALNKSSEQLKSDDLRGALATVKLAEISGKPSADLQTQYAIIYHKMRQVTLAIEHYEKAVQLNPKQETAVNNLSLLYMLKADNLLKKNNLEEAISYYTRAGKLSAKRPGLFLNLGLALARSGRFEQAEKAYLKVLELDKGNKNALQNLLILYERLRQPDKAAQIRKMLNT